MTPFGIRKRIKKLLGIAPEQDAPAAPVRPPREKVTLVVVDGEGAEQSYEGQAGFSPLYISGNMERPIASGCNDSSCATCRIEVLEGPENLSEQDDRERATLAENGKPEHLRLACRAEILRGTVKVRAFEFLV
ncbi:MAG: (2Fe-2S)-binding protein [Alphaproteobacteria bacterium]|nr:(2Fe-2S)-binding protein [Alphaproteobacteria bacterium]